MSYFVLPTASPSGLEWGTAGNRSPSRFAAGPDAASRVERDGAISAHSTGAFCLFRERSMSSSMRA